MAYRSRELIPFGEWGAGSEDSSGIDAHLSKVNSVEVMIVLAVVVASTSLVLVIAWLAHLQIPYGDTFDWTASALDVEKNHKWLSYVWSAHTEQRIPIARIVQALDTIAGRGRFPTYFLSSVVAWSAGLVLLLAAICVGEPSPRLRVWLLGTCTVILCNVMLSEDLSLPVFSVYVFVGGPALGAFVCAQRSFSAENWGAPFLATVMLGLCASFGNAAGLAVWPVLLLMAWFQKAPKVLQGALVATATATIVATEWGLGLAMHGAVGGSGSHLVKVLTYFCVYLGLPWTRGIHSLWLAALLGLAFVAVASLGVSKVMRKAASQCDSLEMIGLSMVTFSVTTAVLAAIGRVDELPSVIVPTRYFPFAAIGQVGALLCWSADLRDVVERKPFFVGAVLSATCCTMLVAEVHAGHQLLGASNRIRAANEILRNTREMPNDLTLYPDLHKALSIQGRMRASGLP